jgi:hypothetical protein
MAKGNIERRGAKRRKTKPVILIVTEGSKTEPKYFKSFRTRQSNIDLHVVGSGEYGGGTDYESLVRKTIAYMEKNGLSAKNGDKLWVVADGDVNYNNADPITVKSRMLDKARHLAERYFITIVLSNPCFEFWYLLHFQYTTGFLKDYDGVVSLLKSYIPDYEKAKTVASQLLPYLSQAIQNAERVERYHVDNGKTDLCNIEINPITAVHRLVADLRRNINSYRGCLRK